MSGHAQHRWYKRYPSDFLAGTRGMRPIAYKTYSRLVDGMYEYGGPLPHDLLHLTHLLEIRPRDLPRLLDELVRLGKIEIADGFIHNKRTDLELGKMNGQDANIEPTQAQHSLNIGSTEPQHEPNIKPNMKAYRGKKRSKNYARAGDPARDHAHPRPEAEAEADKITRDVGALPQTNGKQTMVDHLSRSLERALQEEREEANGKRNHDRNDEPKRLEPRDEGREAGDAGGPVDLTAIANANRSGDS